MVVLLLDCEMVDMVLLPLVVDPEVVLNQMVDTGTPLVWSYGNLGRSAWYG